MSGENLLARPNGNDSQDKLRLLRLQQLVIQQEIKRLEKNRKRKEEKNV